MPSSTLLALAFLVLPQQPTELEQRLSRLEAELESRRASMDIPGIAVAVVRGDEVVLARGFGLADVEAQRPVTPETIFAIGSTTKAFTAALVGTFVAEGELAWDQPVEEVLPGFELHVRSKAADARATFRDLLSHRTGFARADLLWAGGKVEPARVLETIARAEPWTGFREEFLYNNVMVLAAGEACATVAGKPWSELVRARLLGPLGMTSTTTSIADARKDARLAKGYDWDAEAKVFVHKPMRGLGSIAPAGALNSNVLDLSRWVRMQLGRGELEGRRVVPEAVLRECWTPQIEVGGGTSYGMGWFLHDWHGHRVVEHGGNIDGFSAQIAFLPDDGIGFALLANVSATPLQGLSMELVWEHMLGELAQPVAVDPADRAPYLGRYTADFASFHDAVFEVLERDGKLAVDVPGQMTYTLKEPDAEGRWVFEITDQIEVSFQRDAEGRVVGLTMYQAGLTFEVPREGVATPVEIDLADAERYVGEYQHPGFEKPLAVSIRNNRLAIDIPGQMVCELHAPDAEGRRLFRVDPRIHVVFDEEAPGGAVLGLTFVERGVEADCPRVGEAAPAQAPLTLEALHALRRSDERARALSALGAWSMEGKVTMVHMGIEGRLKLTAEGSDRHLVHTDLSPFAVIDLAFDRGVAESRTDISDDSVLTPAQREWIRVDHPASPFGDWRAWYSSIRVIRSEQRGDRPTWVVELKAEEGVALTAWVDAETGDTLFEEFDQPVPNIGSLHRVRSYSDFRELEGLRVPYRSTQEDGYTGRMQFDLERLDPRLHLPDGAFTLSAR